MNPNNKPVSMPVSKPPGQQMQMPVQQQQMQMPVQQYSQIPMQISSNQAPMQMPPIPAYNPFSNNMGYISQAPIIGMSPANCIVPPGANFMGPFGAPNVAGITLLGKDDKQYMTKKTVAIIVSICNGSTYDGLFTTTQQKSAEGTKTMVFSASAHSTKMLIQGFEGKSTDETVKLLFSQIAKLQPDCVVFNWECSSGYSDKSFSQGKADVLKLVSHILKGKHMAMFSDFSLKALIEEWDQSILGPNPFKRMTSEFSSTVQLKFDPETLKHSPSAQLQSVGDLSDGGKCNVHCLGGTIIYSVDMKKTDHKAYNLEILTVAENAPVDNNSYILNIKSGKGAAGHILLTYPNGGKLLTSMGHWIELVKVDTSEQKLFEMAQKQYGATEVMNMQQQMAGMGAQEKYAYVQSQAQMYVQSSAPCNNIATKVAYNQYKS